MYIHRPSHQFGRCKVHVYYFIEARESDSSQKVEILSCYRYRAVERHSLSLYCWINNLHLTFCDKMNPFKLSFALLPLATRATNVVMSNDDGWAEINIRTFYNTLTAAGDSVVLSAPAENESGTGMQFPQNIFKRRKFDEE